MKMRDGLPMIIATLLLASCGTQTSERDTLAAPSDPDDAQAAIVESHRRWAGTADDLQAAQVVRAEALNGEYDSCMQSHGYTEFNFRTQIQLAPVAPDSGLIGLLEPFGQHILRDQALAVARSHAVEYRSNNPETEYDVWNEQVEAATNSCLRQSESASDETIQNLVQPSGLDDLYASWYGDEDVQRALLFDLENSEKYVTCMQVRGYGDGKARESDEASPTLMARLRREVDLPMDWMVISDPARRVNDPDWTAFIEAESAWLLADEECRRGLLAAHIGAVWELQREFESKHASLISDVEEGWAAIRERATSLGWSPGHPFAS